MDRAILWGQFFCDESKMEIPVDTAVLVGPSQRSITLLKLFLNPNSLTINIHLFRQKYYSVGKLLS